MNRKFWDLPLSNAYNTTIASLYRPAIVAIGYTALDLNSFINQFLLRSTRVYLLQWLVHRYSKSLLFWQVIRHLSTLLRK